MCVANRPVIAPEQREEEKSSDRSVTVGNGLNGSSPTLNEMN